MIFKQLDLISPTVSLYYKGYLSHSSILSGILSLFTFILIIIIAAYFSFDLIKREHPTVSYFNSFEEDAGIIPFNSSSLFHFISLALNKQKFYDEGVDFQSFRIIGLEEYYTKYISFNKNLSRFDHWLYGYCDKEKDAKNIENLINLSFFPNSACIRKYFNSKEQKYYDTDDPNFRWPVIAHGTYNSQNKFYCIALEKCAEETINLINGNKHCKSDDEIKELIGMSSAAHFYFIDNYIDVLNYKNPITKFLYRIENAIQSNSYPTNNINFNPSLIKTHNGFVFDNIEHELSFSYERNDMKYNDGNYNTYTVYYIYLKNRINYYERNYKRIQNIVSEIGGIFHFLSFIAIYINRLYNNYIVLYDTQDLLRSLVNVEKENKAKNKIDFKKDIKNIKDIKDKNNKTLDKSNNKILEKGRFNKDKNNIKKENKIIEKNITNMNDISSNRIEIDRIDKNNIFRKNDINTNFNFWYFFLYKLSFEKKNLFFKLYQDFRIKIISEEHLIKNHLNIYNLLRVNKRKINSRKRHIYEIKDLLNLK